jgi:two-component system, OmpR family, phosphate regulon sensor histidine kinase PhoR
MIYTNRAQFKMKSLVTFEPVTALSQLTIPSRFSRDLDVSHADQYTHINAIIDAIHEPVIILDRDLTIQSANKIFLKKFKTTKEKAYGRNLADLTSRSEQMEHLIKKLKKLSRKNSSFEELELTYHFRKVGERTLLINAKRVDYDNRNSDIIFLSIQDITQRRLIERQKDDFVGYVTHELKTPITSSSVFVQLLQGYHEKTGDKKSQFLLAKVAGELERLTKLLNSFTHVYKAQTGMLELQKEQIDLYELVRETVEMFQYTTTTHTISIEGTLTKPVIADKERIRQVIINLLINAIKYSPLADVIVVKLQEEAKKIIMSIRDFGPGIPKEAQTKIFERFFRVRGTHDYSAKGLGLGLYISTEILKAHKGKLWVESTEGKGSTFSFSLPLKSIEEKRTD